MSLVSVELVTAVRSVLLAQLPTKSYVATDDELLRPLLTTLHGMGEFNTHGRGLQLLSSEDVKAAVLVAQACDTEVYEQLKAKVGPQFTLRFDAATTTTYDMIALVYSKLIAERKIGKGSQEEFVARVATHLGASAENQSVFDQVVDALELLKRFGEDVPDYLLNENIMV